MILVDANLLIYSHNTDAAEHPAARAWLESVLSGPQPVRLSWASILAFLRVTTNSSIFPHAYTIAEGSQIVSEWLARPTVDVLLPSLRHWTILNELLARGQVRGPLVSDAHVAALAIEHGATLCTTDRDFARFPGLKWTNPIA